MVHAMASPWKLTWREVDPRINPFKATLAEATAKARPRVPVRDGKREGWEPDVTDVFVKAYGKWASGWCWASGEGTIGGGPVRAWCCAPHSYTTQDATAQKCAEGLLDWRAWLTTLAGWFVELGAKPGQDAESAFAYALPTLIARVAERTGAGDAWYNHAQQVLTWFLESHGADGKRAAKAVHAATKGIWSSWSEPSESELAAVVPEFARVAARQIRIK
jgi:hypothetical protein